MLDEFFDVRVDIGLELADALDGKGIGDDFALAGVLRAVAGVEEAAAGRFGAGGGDEGVVEVTRCKAIRHCTLRRAMA